MSGTLPAASPGFLPVEVDDLILLLAGRCVCLFDNKGGRNRSGKRGRGGKKTSAVNG